MEADRFHGSLFLIFEIPPSSRKVCCNFATTRQTVINKLEEFNDERDCIYRILRNVLEFFVELSFFSNLFLRRD